MTQNPVSLTYIEPEVPAKPFAKGDAVQVMDREGNVLSTRKIVRVRKTFVQTDCNREWTPEGLFSGVRREGIPFPWIRHAR